MRKTVHSAFQSKRLLINVVLAAESAARRVLFNVLLFCRCQWNDTQYRAMKLVFGRITNESMAHAFIFQFYNTVFPIVEKFRFRKTRKFVRVLYELQIIRAEITGRGYNRIMDERS